MERMKIMKRKYKLLGVLGVLILTLVFGTVSAFAADGVEEPTTFNISVKHYVKGDEIGLTREAPVLIQVNRNGQTWTYLHMSYGSRVDAVLPAGIYNFTFLDAETGDTLFKCGAYLIEGGDDVRIQAHEQGPGRIPTCYARK
jgi:hypothetical protein